MKTQLSIVAIIAMAFAVIAATPPPAKVPLNKEVTVKKFSNCFSFFRTHRQGKGITATWGVGSNTGIDGFALQRTYDDPTDPYATWEDINTTNCNSSRSYKFTDENVFPGYVTYRVVAAMSDGGTSCSDLSTVHIVSRH